MAYRDRVLVFEETLNVFFKASNLLYGAEGTQLHISAIPKVSQAVKASVTFSLIDANFIYNSNGRLIDVGGATYRFGVWARDPNVTTRLSYDVVRALGEWPPIYRIDDVRGLLLDRINGGAAATGTATVNIADLTTLNTALASGSVDDTLEQAETLYTLMQDVQDDVDALTVANAQTWLNDLGTLRGRADGGGYFRCESLGDSPRADRIYDLKVFERHLIVDFIRSD